VQLSDDQEPVTGFAALMDHYRGIAAGMADSKHIWTTTVLDDGRIEWGWVSVARGVDVRLMALSGIEHATLDASGVEPKLIEKVAWELLADADRFTRSALIAIGGDLRAHIEVTSEDLVVQTVIALTAP
jgi:hypothetical protein